MEKGERKSVVVGAWGNCGGRRRTGGIALGLASEILRCAQDDNGFWRAVVGMAIRDGAEQGWLIKDG